MVSPSLWQFSLRALFVLTAVVAVGIVVWQWCPVTGVSLSGADVVFHISDEFTQQIGQGGPFSDTPTIGSDTFFHSAVVVMPIYVLVIGLLLIAGCFVVVGLVVRR